MAAQESVGRYNYWAKYRNPNASELDAAGVTARFRVPNPPARAILVDPGAARFPPRNLAFQAPANIGVTPQVDRDILLRGQFRGLPDDNDEHSVWRGISILGQGANGVVAHFKRNMTGARPHINDIAVKMVPVNDAASLDEEAHIMRRLGLAHSQHITAFIAAPNLTNDESIAESLDRVHVGEIRRIIMEYCPLGSLFELLARRMVANRPFQEITLWKIFDCLVDGLSVMETGNETTVDGMGQANVVKDPGWLEIVNLDIKTTNIFLGDKNSRHVTPVCKFGDFGWAEFKDPASPWNEDKLTEMRNTGTETYFSPEQFSEEWDYQGWESQEAPLERIAGAYSAQTNIWGVGIMMSQLIMLHDGTPSPGLPFGLQTGGIGGAPVVPAFFIDGAPARCRTFCVNLRAYNVAANPPGTYSVALTDLVHQCLYEKPSYRPTIIDLKTKICARIEDLFEGGAVDEPWTNFTPPGQIVVPIAPPMVGPQFPPPLYTGPINPIQRGCNRIVGRHLTVPPGRFCLNPCKAAGVVPNRCGKHQNLVSFPYQ